MELLSGISESAPLDQLRVLLRHVESKRCTIAGESVNYVDKKVLAHMQELLIKAVNSPLPAELKELDKARKRVEQLSQDRNEMESEKDKWLAAAKNLNDKVAAQQSNFQEKSAQFNVEFKKLKDELSSARGQESFWQSQCDNLKHKMSLAASKYDPEHALEIQQSLDDALSKLQDSMDSRKSVDADLKVAQEEIANMSAELQDLKQKRSSAWASFHEHTHMEKLLESKIPVQPRVITYDGTVLKMVLGDHGYAWLKKLDVVQQTDLRERVYAMLQVVKHSPNKTLNPYKLLLQSAIDTIKKGVGRAYVMMYNWVTTLENDIKTWSFKPLSYYRKELEQIVASLKVQAQKATANAEKRYTRAKRNNPLLAGFVKPFEVAYYRLNSKLRKTVKIVRRWATKLTTMVSTFACKVKDSFNPSRSTVPAHTIFLHEEDEETDLYSGSVKGKEKEGNST